MLRSLQAALECSGAAQYRGDRAHQDAHVEPERPLLNILAVEVDHVLEIEHLAAPTYLPKACYAGFRVEPTEVMVLVVAEIRFEERARADQRHLSDENVEQLRQLVETPPSQESPETRCARVILDLEQTPVLGMVEMRE